jgi:hypothetical protein
VNILDDQHGRMLGPAQFGTQGGEHAVTFAAVRYGAAELGSTLPTRSRNGPRVRGVARSSQ